MLTKTLRFDGKILAVEVCETQSEMEKGLMWVDHLSEDRGMLFKLSSGSQPKFWMKNTFIPLDIAYIDSSMKIIKIDQMQPHSGKSSCDIPAKFAVEAPLGWFQRNQIKSGCKMEMPESNEVRSIIEEILEEIYLSVRQNNVLDEFTEEVNKISKSTNQRNLYDIVNEIYFKFILY